MEISLEQLTAIVEKAVAMAIEKAMKPTVLTKKRYLNIAEAVEYLASAGFHTTNNGIYTMVSRGQLKADKINGKLAFTIEELERIIGERTINRGSLDRAAEIIRSSKRFKL